MLMMFLLYLELFAQPGKHWVSSGIAFCASSIANMLVIALPIINIKIKNCSVFKCFNSFVVCWQLTVILQYDKLSIFHVAYWGIFLLLCMNLFIFVTKKNKCLTKQNIFSKGKIENLSDDTVKIDFKELLNKEQIDYKELFTDYQLFYTTNLLLSKELLLI